jgi:DNA-binding MarR family transcriptional regulator
MENARKILNELLVEMFNHILILESKNLQDKGIKLSMSEVHTIENIQKSESKTMSDVAKRSLVTSGTLTVAINRLEDKGYIKRVRDEHDRRIIRLALTSKAKSAMAIHDEFHENMINSFISDLNVDEDTALIGSLQKIMDYFKQNY